MPGVGEGLSLCLLERVIGDSLIEKDFVKVKKPLASVIVVNWNNMTDWGYVI